MTQTPASIPQSINPGAVDAAINLALTTLLCKDDNSGVGAYNLESSAQEALFQLLQHRAADVASNVMERSGFEIGVEAARIVIESPLMDCSERLGRIIDKAIAHEREEMREEAQLAAAKNSRTVNA